MKKHDYPHYAALALLSHAAQCCALILLLFAAAGSTSSFTFASPGGLALDIAFTAALSLAFGWGLRPKLSLSKNVCWNGATVLYLLNFVALLYKGSPALSAHGAAELFALLFALPMLPAFVGIEELFPSGAARYAALALLAAVEPLCFTLGLLRPVKAKTNGAPTAGAADTENDFTNPTKENEEHE